MGKPEGLSGSQAEWAGSVLPVDRGYLPTHKPTHNRPLAAVLLWEREPEREWWARIHRSCEPDATARAAAHSGCWHAFRRASSLPALKRTPLPGSSSALPDYGVGKAPTPGLRARWNCSCTLRVPPILSNRSRFLPATNRDRLPTAGARGAVT